MIAKIDWNNFHHTQNTYGWRVMVVGLEMEVAHHELRQGSTEVTMKASFANNASHGQGYANRLAFYQKSFRSLTQTDRSHCKNTAICPG